MNWNFAPKHLKLYVLTYEAEFVNGIYPPTFIYVSIIYFVPYEH